jgi:hypothetical protein
MARKMNHCLTVCKDGFHTPKKECFSNDKKWVLVSFLSGTKIPLTFSLFFVFFSYRFHWYRCPLVILSHKKRSPAATLSISHPKIAGDCVSVDLAPLVEAHLPFRPEFGWPRSNARWPSGSKIHQIKATGIHDVATDPLTVEFVVDWQLHWPVA